MGAILCRAGCWGSGSTEQPTSLDEIPKDEPLVMIIRHHNLLIHYVKLIEMGYEVTAIMTVREWYSNVKSLVSRGHCPTEKSAQKQIKNTLVSNLFDATLHNIPIIICTYEGITDEYLYYFLEKMNLKNDNLHIPLELKGQEYTNQTYFPKPLEQNKKHYEVKEKQLLFPFEEIKEFKFEPSEASFNKSLIF